MDSGCFYECAPPAMPTLDLRLDLTSHPPLAHYSTVARLKLQSISHWLTCYLQNFLLIHVSLVPCIGTTGEHKTKPTQHSIRELRGLGLSPDIVCHCALCKW